MEFHRKLQLPAMTGLNPGDVYWIPATEDPTVANEYKVDNNGVPIFVRGIDADQQARLTRLNNGQITKLEGLKTQSEINSDINDAMSNATGSIIPVSGSVLPRGASIPYYITNKGKAELLGGVIGKTFTNTGKPIPDDKFTIPANNVGYAYYDKAADTWSLGDVVPMPTATGTDVLQNEEIPKGKAVVKYVEPTKEKVDNIIEAVVDGEIINKDITATSVSYGVNIYGWGFPAVGRRKVKAVIIDLGTDGTSTSQKLVIKKNNSSGEVLFSGNFSKTISGIRKPYRFDLSAVIENENADKLWIEIYGNSPLSIYRVNPATVFTQGAGYTFPRYTINNDMGDSGFTGGADTAYYDIYHEVVTEKNVTDFTPTAKDLISDIANENLVLPNSVNDTLNKVEDHLVTDINPGGNYIPFTDTLGPQGNTYYKIGFPIGNPAIFDKITIPVHYDATKIKPTSLTIKIRQVNKDGLVVANSTVPFTGGAGRTDVDFTFTDLIDSRVNLYVEIDADGQIGVYRRYPNPSTIFTEANGYPSMSNSLTSSGELGYIPFFHDFWFQTNSFIKTTTLKGVSIEVPEDEIGILGNENERISFTGSSVTWGDGFLQSGYVAEFIKNLQSKVATVVLPNSLNKGTPVANRMLFLGEATRLEGANEEVEFSLTGNEVSIVQAIERSNVNASVIQVFIDDVLHDTINNFNPEPIGNESKTYTGDGVSVMFDLGKAFTYNHTVNINGVNKVVTLNINASTGFTIPTSSDCAIVRKLGQDSEGNTAVTHWLWFKSAPLLGEVINISYDFGRYIMYERTSIGQNIAGVNECPYGDGDVSFDPTAPAGISSGLDFRQTEDKVVHTYRFLENKKRKVKLKISGLYPGATGAPYFVFNFATNRYFHFQNAGIGGWDLWDLDKTLSEDYLRGWQRVLEFNPDKLVIETTPNDDWIVKGHKLYNIKNVNLSTLRGIKNFPLRSISFDSGSDTYNIGVWRGVITDINTFSVTFDGSVSTPIVPGDVVMIGQYWANNEDYIERLVSSISGNTIYFDKPISKDESIYPSLQNFIGKEVGVRDLSVFKNKLTSIIDKFRNLEDCPIYLLENPMPNVLARELWGYPIIMDQIANSKQNVFSVKYDSLREWQNSQPKTSTVVNVSSATLDPYLGKKVIEFGNNGQNILSVDVLVNGISIYGKKAVVQNGWAYTVNQNNTGTSLNKSVSAPTNSGQVFNGRKPRVVLLDETLTGNVTVVYSSILWSNDSCHMNTNSSKLYADFLKSIYI